MSECIPINPDTGLLSEYQPNLEAVAPHMRIADFGKMVGRKVFLCDD